jgi:Rad3-related DNA helicase
MPARFVHPVRVHARALYPGLQKVVQAAGRVIRSQQDQGVVMLIDDRFGEARVRPLLPSWWAISS